MMPAACSRGNARHENSRPCPVQGLGNVSRSSFRGPSTGEAAHVRPPPFMAGGDVSEKLMTTSDTEGPPRAPLA
jgi:hypothetical protein